jgi:hypothetical protein
MMAEREALDREHEELRGASLAHQRAWAELELALSTLLYEVLRLEPHSSRVAYALYCSPTGFEARTQLLHNALSQLIVENAGLAPLVPLWTRTHRKIDQSAKDPKHRGSWYATHVEHQREELRSPYITSLRHYPYRRQRFKRADPGYNRTRPKRRGQESRTPCGVC